MGDTAKPEKLKILLSVVNSFTFLKLELDSLINRLIIFLASCIVVYLCSSRSYQEATKSIFNDKENRVHQL